MKILITGGAGYVGASLLQQLCHIEESLEIIIYDNLIRGNYQFFLGQQLQGNHKITFIEGDILDSRKLKKVVNEVDVVYHLAAKVTTPFADQTPHLFEQINHWGTAELVYAVEESNVSQLIFLSSASVYGASEEEVTTKSEPQPRTFYGIAKRNGEKHVERLLGSKVDTSILRCGNVFGYNESMRFDAVINKFLFDAHFKKRITIFGDGLQKRSFIHVELLAKVMKRLLLEKHAGIFNISSHTWCIEEIGFKLKEYNPNLELLYVNQNTRLRELFMEEDLSLMADVDLEQYNLDTAIKGFKYSF